jgi:hypothetical protein
MKRINWLFIFEMAKIALLAVLLYAALLIVFPNTSLVVKLLLDLVVSFVIASIFGIGR